MPEIPKIPGASLPTVSNVPAAPLSVMSAPTPSEVDSVPAKERFNKTNPANERSRIAHLFSPSETSKLTTSVIQRSGENLESIHNFSNAGISSSSVKGVSLSPGQNRAISNSKLFEAGASMAILDNPGKVGLFYDASAARLSTLLEKVFSDESIGGKSVFFRGARTTLAEAFQLTLVHPLSAKSDQVGRQPKDIDMDTKSWLVHTLSTPLVDANGDNLENYDFRNLLTKIRMHAALGTLLYLLMNPDENKKDQEPYPVTRGKNMDSIKALLDNALPGKGLGNEVEKRSKAFSSKTRTPLFDNPLRRARSERMPVVTIDGKREVVKGIYESGFFHNLGFGQVVQNVEAGNEKQQVALRAALGEKNENINGIERVGAPIADLSRPFTMSENELENIPKAYGNLNIPGKLREHAHDHGAGVNRWQPFGTFTLELGQRGLPSAGAQSGSTCDVLLAAHILSDKPMYGNHSAALPAILGASSLMNFGAYHTFGETFPIGEAVAANVPYVPSGREDRKGKDIYSRFAQAVENYASPKAGKEVAEFLQAHGKTLEEIKSQHPELEQTPDPFVLEFYATDDGKKRNQ